MKSLLRFVRYRSGILIVLVLVIVAVVGVRFVLSWNVGHSNPSEESQVSQGGDYYVSVVLVELAERNPDGNSWDSLDGSAPDPRIEIIWRGQKVFESSFKKNTLIAHWSNAEIDLKSLALSGGKTSVDELVQGARINVIEAENLEIRVIDHDPLSPDDEAGRLIVPTSELLVGDKQYYFKGDGLRRVVLRVQSMTENPDLLG